MNNRDIASILKEVALYKELAGENPFKARAFEQAAHTIETTTEDICSLAKEGKLREIKGVGKGVEAVIIDLVEAGRSQELEELKSSFPDTIRELLSIQGMGPRKVKTVWEKLKVATIGELEYACKENRLLTLEGFGEKTQAKILKAIEFKKLYRDRHLISEALSIANQIVCELQKKALFSKVSIAGSLRRGKGTFKDIDILLVPKNSTKEEDVSRTLLSLIDTDAEGDEIIGAGHTKVSIRREGLQIDFRIVDEQAYPAALQHFTGSKMHNTLLRGRAKKMGLKMNEYGLFRGEERLNIETEEDVYKALGLPFISPEIREGEDEIIAAEQGRLPRLVERSDLKGMIHVHSNYSDGSNSLEELARACIEHGYTYLCISDHSRSAFYAHGLSEERVIKQIQETERLNVELEPFRIFSGIESDILSDGSLDYPEEILKKFDFVIGSIHSKLSMSLEDATVRLIRAIKNPYMTILGHIGGGLLLSREGYEYDQQKILSALKEHHVVLEHNCNPHRLDPDWQFLKKAFERKILVSIDPDAHSIDGFRDIEYGLIMARKAWIQKEGLLNCMAKDEIEAFFKQKKTKAHTP